DRINAGVPLLDFFKLKELTFIEPDFERYPNLKVAIDAFAAGQYATTAMNAANEIAVDAFLNKQIRFTDIVNVNRSVVENMAPIDIQEIDDVLHIDKLARELAKQIVLQI
ncbi:MAG: 1-deoxy-D-xylulose-5-phosphate reductoisomerase, partial [Haemophilus parahaemolyticus]|nr:1-deoxy-D-xylulose-5-phosphate reductoisomerase [Haemophilus parahaemolyticus]